MLTVTEGITKALEFLFLYFVCDMQYPNEYFSIHYFFLAETGFESV